MPVLLTSPVEGLQPGDTYTGPNEAYHLASGYAIRTPAVDATNGAYTGPGVANTGPADAPIAANREFDATRSARATDSLLPFGGTNDGVVTSGEADRTPSKADVSPNPPQGFDGRDPA